MYTALLRRRGGVTRARPAILGARVISLGLIDSQGRLRRTTEAAAARFLRAPPTTKYRSTLEMSELVHEAFVLTTDPIAADPPARPSPTLVVSTAYGVTFSEPLITNCLASRLLFRATGWTREGEAAVFRLTATNGEDGQGPVLKVEGRLVGAWVDELERAVATATESSQTLTLDLNGLSFVDTHGVELLRRAARQGARLVGGSAFVTTLIPQED